MSPTESLSSLSPVFRIFVSSTFSDMEAERNALHRNVFPQLRRFCEARGARFQAIDLRWGVSEEAGVDHRTMKICFDEIERCQRATARPNFVVLLGNRYGWRPPPAEIPSDEFEVLLQHLPPAEREFLNHWYCRDDNSVPAAHLLRAREGKYLANAEWKPVETRLHHLLRGAAKDANLDWKARLKYDCSATEQEIQRGVFDRPAGSHHAYCFFRNATFFPVHPQRAQFTDVDETGEPDSDAETRLTRLKGRLRDALPGSVFEYPATWDAGGVSAGHVERLCDDVFACLSRVILEELAQRIHTDALAREVAAHLAFATERARSFIGREVILGDIGSYVRGANNHPLAIVGPSGVGKSALLARAGAAIRAEHPQASVIQRFVGATPESSNPRSLLEQICREVAQIYGDEEYKTPGSYPDLVAQFGTRLSAATADHPLIVMIDALDHLRDESHADVLGWLSAVLPPYVRLIVSSLPHLELALERRGVRILTLEPMAAKEGADLLSLALNQAGRTLTTTQRKTVLNGFAQNGLPLYLAFAVEECKRWRSFDAITSLGVDVESIIEILLGRLSSPAHHGLLLTERSLGYLAAAKSGLSENELIDNLSLDDVLMGDFRNRSHHTLPDPHLPVVVWSRFYFDLAPYLVERNADGTSVLAFFHRQLADVVAARYLNTGSEHARHRHLTDYFSRQPLTLEANAASHPNLRRLSELPYQQGHAGLWDSLKATLTDLEFIETKLAAINLEALLDDYMLTGIPGLVRHPDDANGCVRLMNTLRLSGHVLENNRSELYGQLLGRLLNDGAPELQKLLAAARKHTRYSWVCPLTRILQPPGGPLVRTLTGHQDPLQAVAVTTDARRIISAARDNTIKVWDFKSGATLQTVADTNNHGGHATYNVDFLQTFDDLRFISISSHSVVTLWDIDTGAELIRFDVPGRYSPVITKDGRRAVFAGPTVWDVNGKTVVFKQAAPQDNAFALTPDEERLLSGGGDSDIRVLELSTGKKLQVLRGHTHHVYKMAVTTDGARLLSAAHDGTVRLWDLDKGEPVHVLPSGRVYDFALTKNGRRAALVLWDDTFRVWDLEQGRELYSLPCGSGLARQVVLTPDDRHALVGDHRNLRMFDIVQGVEVCRFEGHSSAITAFAIAPAAECVVTASDDKTLKIWHLGGNSTGEQQRTGNQTAVSKVVLTRDSVNALISGSGYLRLVQVQTASEIWHKSLPQDWTADFTISSDTPRFLYTAADGSLTLCDLDTGVDLMSLTEAQRGATAALALAPDATKAWIVGSELRVAMFDLRVPAVAARLDVDLRAAVKALRGVVISDDCRRLVIISQEDARSTAYGVQGEPIVPADTRYTVWNLEERRKERETQHDFGATVFAVSGTCCLAVSAIEILDYHNRHYLIVIDLVEGAVLRTIEAHTAPINSVALSTDGAFAATASDDGVILIWSLLAGEQIARFSGESGLRVRAIGPDAEYIAATDAGGRLHVLRLVKPDLSHSAPV